MTPEHDVTLILGDLERGDPAAVERLLPLVHAQLRELARSRLAGRAPLSLEPTALVHEAFLKLVRSEGAGYRGREHFMAVAATAMRQILADHARQRRREKRGGGRDRITLHDEITPAPSSELDLLDLNEALEELRAMDARMFRVVEMRFFGGLTVDETAKVLAVSRSTVEETWRGARAWLSARLAQD